MKEELKKTGRDIKKALKLAFPEVKFQVKTCRSAYDKVEVHWTDGPSVKSIDNITAPFDSSVDSSDIQRDYFRITGISINLYRELAEEYSSAIEKLASETISKDATYAEIIREQELAYKTHRVHANAPELMHEYYEVLYK